MIPKLTVSRGLHNPDFIETLRENAVSNSALENLFNGINEVNQQVNSFRKNPNQDDAFTPEKYEAWKDAIAAYKSANPTSHVHDFKGLSQFIGPAVQGALGVHDGSTPIDSQHERSSFVGASKVFGQTNLPQSNDDLGGKGMPSNDSFALRAAEQSFEAEETSKLSLVLTDGTDSEEEVLRKTQEKGIQVIGVGFKPNNNLEVLNECWNRGGSHLLFSNTPANAAALLRTIADQHKTPIKEIHTHRETTGSELAHQILEAFNEGKTVIVRDQGSLLPPMEFLDAIIEDPYGRVFWMNLHRNEAYIRTQVPKSILSRISIRCLENVIPQGDYQVVDSMEQLPQKVADLIANVAGQEQQSE